MEISVNISYVNCSTHQYIVYEMMVVKFAYDITALGSSSICGTEKKYIDLVMYNPM